MRRPLLISLLAVATASAAAAAAPAAVLVNQTPFASVDGLTLTGQAQFAPAEQLVRLTTNENEQQGRMFTASRLATTASFSTRFKLSMHDSSTISHADGIAFVLQQTGDSATTAIGGGLGYQGFSPSVAVEFDTWQNNEIGEPDGNHVEVTTTDAGGTLQTVERVTAPFDLYGTPFFAWVDYDNATTNFEVYVARSSTKPATPLVDEAVDVAAIVPTDAFAGLTAATGSQNEFHDVRSWVLTGSPFDPCAPGTGAILGTSSGETLTGTSGDDVICGLGGNDTIRGGGGDDEINGGEGNDTLNGEGGADRMIGGNGTDTVTYADSSGFGVIVDLQDVGPTDGELDEGDDVRDDVENAIGSHGPDFLLGSAKNNALRGLADGDVMEGRDGVDTVLYSERTSSQPVFVGNDGESRSGGAIDAFDDTISTSVENLTGGAGNDFLAGNEGNNVLDGGPGSDVFDGGFGRDTVTYETRTTAVFARIHGRPLSGNSLDEAGVGQPRDTITTSVENIRGGSGDDTLVGSFGANVLTGGRGADILTGREGNDTLSAADGVADTELDCDGAAAAGAGDKAVIDAGLDPAPVGCESVTS